VSTTRTFSQHSTADLRGQSADEHQANLPGRLARRFGDLLAAGYTALPNALFEYQAALGLGDGELLFIQQLWSYWWGDVPPHPALPTLAARMGKSVRQLQYYVERLRRVGILRVIERYDSCGRRLPNGYDLQPVLEALRTHCHQHEAERGTISTPSESYRDVPLHSRTTDQPLSDTSAMPHVGESVVVESCHQGTVQPTSPSALQPTAGEVDDIQQDLEFDSIPPQAGQQLPSYRGDVAPVIPKVPTAADPIVRSIGTAVPAVCHATAVAGPVSPKPTAAAGPLPGPLAALAARLGRLVGDASPRSTLSRIAHIGQRYGVDEPVLIARLSEAADRMRDIGPEILRRTPSGTPNGMPYLLAALESLLQPTPEPSAPALHPVSPHRPAHDRCGSYTPDQQHTDPAMLFPPAMGARHPDRPASAENAVNEEPPTSLPVPLWSVLLAAMREIVAPGVQRVLEHELVATVDGDSLILSAPSQFRAAWIERSLRHHLEDRLLALSPEPLTLRIVAAAARAGI